MTNALTDAAAAPSLAPARAVVVMGPAGSGKSFIGTRLAEALGWTFVEGDEHHPAENVARMRAGLPLDDAMRTPWLAALAALVARAVAGDRPVVIACSALRVAYRQALVPAGAPPGAVRFVYLHADPALLAARLAGRAGHFFAPALLGSQLAALEPPGAAAEDEPAPVLTLDAAQAPEALVAAARAALGV